MHELKKLLRKVSSFSILQRLIITFTIIIVIPLFITYYSYKKSIEEIIINQTYEDSINAIELEGNDIDEILNNMKYISLFLSEDNYLKELLSKETDNEMSYEKELKLLELDRVNRISNIFRTITYNSSLNDSYLTLITKSGRVYTNWQYYGKPAHAYIKEIKNEINSGDSRYKWRGLEKNYVYGGENQSKYVYTLMNDIYEDSWSKERIGTVIISMPESELRSNLIQNHSAKQQMLLDHEMNIVSSSSEALIGKNLEGVTKAIIPNNDSGYFIFSDEEIGKTFVSYYKLEDNKWRIIEFLPYEDITRDLSIVSRRILLITIVCMGVFLSFAVMIANAVAKPINQLAKQMNEVDLNFVKRSDKGKRLDEIALLEESFDNMSTKITQLMNENVEKEKRKREAEFEALQAQISPHFLFNTLNAIRWAAINKKNNKAADMTMALGNLLRMTIAKRDQELISLAQEIQNIKYYVAIIQMRHSIKFEVEYKIQESLANILLPKLLLQPIVENAIIHGFEDNPIDGRIIIAAYEESERLIIMIKDNGKGISQKVEDNIINKSFKFTGIGFKNVDERIKLYFGEDYGLHFESNQELGTSVYAILPKENTEVM